MDWSIQDFGAIGEVVGGIGVIASLLYLGTQIRSSARQSRADAIYNMQIAQSDVEELCATREVATVLAKQMTGETLEDFESIQLDFVIARVTGVFSAIQAAADNGLVDQRFVHDASTGMGIFARRFNVADRMWSYVRRAHYSVMKGKAFEELREAANVATLD